MPDADRDVGSRPPGQLAQREDSADPAEPNSAEWLRLLAAEARESSICTLDHDGTVLRWSPSAERLYGYCANEIIGRHVSIFYLPEETAAGEPRRQLASATELGSHATEGWRIRKDGTRFWARVIITVLRSADGNLRGFAKVVRDETASRASRQFSTMLRAMVEGSAPDAVLNMIAEQTCQILGAAQTWIATALSGEPTLTLRVAASLDAWAGLPQVGTPIPDPLRGQRGKLLDLATACPELARHYDLGPALAWPLAVGDRNLGALVAAHRSGRWEFREGDLELVSVLGNEASLVLEFHRAQHELAAREVLADRDRIAQEINDTIIRDLFAISMAVHGSAMRVDPALRAHLSSAVDDLDNVVQRLQTTVFDLHHEPQPVPDLGELIFALADKAGQALGTHPQIAFKGSLTGIPRPHAEHLLATLRETLSSLVQIHQVTEARIGLSVTDDLTLWITHDGPPALTADRARAISEHARQLGGDACLDTQDPATTILVWHVPLTGPKSAA